MSRTNEFTEILVDYIDGRLKQTRFSNLWLGGGAGPEGGSSFRPIDGQITQRHVSYDTSEPASPCAPSGFSSLVDNLRRMRYWQEPATWFGVETTSGLQVTIKPGLWYPSTTEYCAFAGGDSPTFTLPGVLDRVDTVYVDPSGILHIEQGTPDVSPTITLPAIASGIPLWAVYLTPTASGIYHPSCSGYYAGQGYIERDLRPFLNLGGTGTAASGVPNATAEGQALISDAALEWTADTTPLWKGEHSFEAGISILTGQGITMADETWIGIGVASERIIFDTAGDICVMDAKFGINTIAVPYAGHGAAMLALHGTDVSEDGPHIQITTDNDDYPLLQVLANKHDKVHLVFDAYYDYASWKSSDLGSNCMLHKEDDLFQISWDEGVGAGNAVTWNTSMVMDLTTGLVGIGIGFVAPAAFLHIKPTGIQTTDVFVIEGTYNQNSVVRVEPTITYTAAGPIAIALSPVFDLDVNVTHTYGQLNISDFDGTANVTTTAIAALYRIRLLAAFSGTITTARILQADLRDSSVSGGTITDAQGLYIGALDGYISGTAYGIYQVGASDLNYFAGDVGIGVLPSYRLDVKDDTAGLFVGNFFNDGDNVNRHVLSLQGGADNGAAVGTTYYIYAEDGDGHVTGCVCTIDGVFQTVNLSDEGSKVNIETTKVSGLDIVNDLLVRVYNWKSNPDGPPTIGFVAQEAQVVYPNMVTEFLDAKLGTSRTALIPILTKAIQELTVRIERLEIQ